MNVWIRTSGVGSQQQTRGPRPTRTSAEPDGAERTVMTNPQQPELHRSGYGESTQDAQELRAEERDNAADEGGSTSPTPTANLNEDERRSGSASTTRDALEDG